MNLTDVNDFRPEEVSEAIRFAINNGWVRPPRWVPKHGDLVQDRDGILWVAIIAGDGELRFSRSAFYVTYDELLNTHGPLEPLLDTPDAI